MTGRTFVDSNVLVYARDTRDRAKQARAADWLAMLWRARTGRIGIQVLWEYYVTVTRKLRPGLSADEAWDDVRLLMSWRPQPLDEQLLEHGRDIERRFRWSWWDSLVVAAAQLQDCSTLLSEGFQNGMEFDTVVVSNPFALKAGESGPPYNVAETAIPRHRPRGRPKRRE